MDTLTEALIKHARLCPARKVDSTPYGDKWVVEGPFRGRDGRIPTIRTVWQYDHGSDIPRFITLVPVG